VLIGIKPVNLKIFEHKFNIMKDNLISKPFRFLLFFLIVPCLMQAQKIAVTGSVRDASGEPLTGVSVVERGTSNGISTDIDGNFTLNVLPQAVLDVSYLGYLPQQVAVNGRTRIEITLAEDAKALEEVVVIGYGTQRREAVTGSVASMAGTSLREVQTGNVTSALAGRIAGVQMSQTSSRPGEDMQIRIRGVKSLSGSNDPLIVLDGIPYGGKLGDISPNDIKSIDILKDASSTAIYGARGANGVIIITTVKGASGQKTKINYDGYYGVRTLYSPFPMMNGDELYQLRKDAGIYVNSDGSPQMGTDEVLGNNTDWQSLLFKPGMTTNHNLRLSGGTDGGAYNFGVGYNKDKSMLPGQDYSRINIMASLDQNIGKHFHFGLKSNSNYNVTNGSNLGIYNTLSASPLIDPYNSDGTYKSIVHMYMDNIWTPIREHYEDLGDSYANNIRAFGTYNSAFGEIKNIGIEGLSYRITLGLDYRASNTGGYTGTDVFSSSSSQASAYLSKSTYYKWNVEHLLTYEKMFGKHHLTLNGLYSAEQSHNDGSFVSGLGLDYNEFQYWNIGYYNTNSYDASYQSFSEIGIISQMGRVMYDYDSRYMLMASIRRDGSSILAEGHKYITYPAFSAGWNIAKESFMQDAGWVDNLKLRIGWGKSANQSFRPYTTLGSMAPRKYNFGTDYVTGLYVSSTPNPNLTWEYTEGWNGGLDFSFLRNRLWGSIDYYNIQTNNLIQNVTLPATAGVGSYAANIGNMLNKGLEVGLNGVIFENKDGWSWSAGLNFYTNHNEITKLATGQERDASNCWFVGHPVNVVYDYKKIGIWQADEVDQLNALETGGSVGMIKVEYTGEYNADGTPVRKISADDRQIMSADPKFQGGYNTQVSYKRWELSLLGTFQHGGLLVSSLHATNGYLNMMSGRRNNVKVDYWTPENTDAKYPKPGVAMNGDNQRYASTLGYFDASFLKIGQITLGYNFNTADKWFKDLGMSQAKLYFTVQNVYSFFSPYASETGLDPTTNSYGNQNAAVTSSLPYNGTTMLTVGTNAPQTRNYIFGLNISF
jgi:TonB-linked SusC/RagA family outer membrane protein